MRCRKFPRMTSMERLLGRTVPLPEVAEAVAARFGEVFGRVVERLSVVAES